MLQAWLDTIGLTGRRHNPRNANRTMPRPRLNSDGPAQHDPF
jgi:hypothetical protein